MNTTFATLLLLVAPSGAGDELVRDIVETGHKKVGVIPTVINRRGDREATIGSLGPRGKVMANAIYEKLVEASQSGRYKGKYRVIPERIMRGALKARTLDDLSKPRKLQELAEDVGGVDGFITIDIDEDTSLVDYQTVEVKDDNFPDEEEGDKDVEDEEEGQDDEKKTKKKKKTLTFKGKAEVTDPNDGTVTSTARYSDDVTLSKAAYQGESWEIRRWDGDNLENTGIDLEGDDAFGRGSAWERVHYVKLSGDSEHPYEDSTFPYPIAIKVDGEIREPQTFGDKYVVELNAGEEYSVILRNDADQDIYAALYIDGLNSINQELIEPEELETKLHWRLEKDKGDREVRGWYKIDYQDNGKLAIKSYKKFTVVDRAESVAAGQGFEDNIGMITAIFYTVGMKNIDEPEGKAPRALPDSIVGTGEGEEVEAEGSGVRGAKRGLMLAAWTFYYRTRDRIEEIESGDTDDFVFDGDEGFVSFGGDGKEDEDDGEDDGEEGDADEDDDKEDDEDEDDETLEIIDFD